ncbi:MAG: GNVR domain-containing protein [Trueperaceae bacterium]|nr:GNVR domain-containing protein [Trueperaceae bacterium]
MSTSHSSNPPGRPYPPPYDDEISLRELYLILRRGLPLILGLALLAGVAAYVVTSVRPNSYEAEATVLSSPSAVRVRDQGTLQFEPGDVIGFDAYETIATSRAVFERTLQRLDDALGDDALGYRDLEGVAEVERVAGSQGNGQASLIVAHRISWNDPELAAAFTNAWSEATVQQVRDTLLANLAPTQEDTAETVERRRAALDEIETELEAFSSQDPRDELRQRLSGLAQRHASNDARLDTLDRRIADARGRLAAMGRAPASALDDASLQLLRRAPGPTAEEAPDGESADEALPNDALLIEGPNAAVLADLAAADLAGALREREAAEALRSRFETQGRELRTRLAELDRRGEELQRRVRQAREAYTSVAELQPLIDYVADLTPGNTRMINSAQAPLEPTGPRKLLITALSVVVMGMLATLFVFLREAVRDPEASPDASRPRAPADTPSEA